MPRRTTLGSCPDTARSASASTTFSISKKRTRSTTIFYASRAPMTSENGAKQFGTALASLLVALVVWVGCADFSRGERLGSGGLPDAMGNGSDGGSSSSYAASVHD